jgi:hypothetical protein
MPTSRLALDRLFDRTWRPGHAFCPRTGRVRRLCMPLLLILLCLIIFGYNYITDSDRVRTMAETYLSRLIGGRVEVGKATLSIFEGLRLDNVKVYVDETPTAPDALIFEAQTFDLTYDPRDMLEGRLQASLIKVQKPRVLLTQDVTTGSWNYHRLGKHRAAPPRPQPTAPSKPILLPEVLLRNARVEINELRGKTVVSTGFVAIDGQLTPGPDGDHYNFELQSRGVEGVGPYVSGSVLLSTGDVSAELRNFEFGRDVLSVLPTDVRQWCERHELAGRVDLPSVVYSPHGNDGRPRFRVETSLNGVTLAVHPEEWMSSREAKSVRRLDSAFALMRPLYAAAGYVSPTSPGATTIDEPTEALDPIDHLAEMLRSEPIRLTQASGQFVFTDAGITISDLSGRVEGIGFAINGNIAGYGPDAPAHLTVASPQLEDLYLPAAPTYMRSLPHEVREWYEQVHPQGTCRFLVDVNRPTPDERPIITGQFDLLDGQFDFNEFPYPLQGVTGRVEYSRDAASGRDFIHLYNIRGHGVPGGPNHDRYLTVNGWVGPIGPEDPEVVIDVHGEGISMEPTLRSAFPPEVLKAFATMDAPGKGQYPTFHGDLSSHIHKPLASQHWTFDTDMNLDDAAAIVPDFPYPLEHGAGLIQVRDGYVDLKHMAMHRAGAAMQLDGRIYWEMPKPVGMTRAQALAVGPPATDLRLHVTDLPIDDALLKALPADKSEWLGKIGLVGKFDVDGTLSQKWIVGALPAPGLPPRTDDGLDRTDVNMSMALKVHDAAIQPDPNSTIATDVQGLMHLTADHLIIDSLTGKRGDARLAAFGAVTFYPNRTGIALDATAQNVLLDASAYTMLPPAARGLWDEIGPHGTLDAHVTWGGWVDSPPSLHPPLPTNTPPHSISIPTSLDGRRLPGMSDGFRGSFEPRDLSINPKRFPYRLDHLAGSVTMAPDKIVLDSVTARHGDAAFAVSGVGDLTSGAGGAWRIKLTGSNVTIDDHLRHALPTSIASSLDALKVQGRVGFNLSDVRYGPAAAAATSAATAPTPTGPQLDCTGVLDVAGGSLDVGVPMTDIDGQVRLKLAARDGRLDSLNGAVALANVTLSGRKLQNVHVTISKASGVSQLQFAKLTAKVAGGQLAGDLALNFPPDGPGQYATTMVLHDADVRELTDDADKGIQGSVTASLSLEGTWNDPTSRKGRGDVLVEGKQLYRIPLVLGLLQVTNLALPIAQPFNHGSARYNVDGQRVNFEHVELKSPVMLLDGDGFLDFGSRQVRMSFTTDNPSGLKLPVITDILQNAQHELLRINVRGTIQEPRVEPSVLGTFTTTVDEVFRGDSNKK